MLNYCILSNKHIVLWLVGYDPYDTPYYGRNLALAIVTCFFTLFVFIFIVNFLGFLSGHIGGSTTVITIQGRTAQI